MNTLLDNEEAVTVGNTIARMFAPQWPPIVEIWEEVYSYQEIGKAELRHIFSVHARVYNVTFQHEVHFLAARRVSSHLRLVCGVGLASLNYGSVKLGGSAPHDEPVIAYRVMGSINVVQGDPEFYYRRVG